MNYFKVTYWLHFCSIQGIVTFNHRINCSSNISSRLYKAFHFKDSWVLFQTCIDKLAIHKVPLSILAQQPGGLKDNIYPFSNVQQLQGVPETKQRLGWKM